MIRILFQNLEKFEIQFFLGFRINEFFYHLPKFESRKLIRNLLLFFRNLLVFLLHKTDIKIYVDLFFVDSSSQRFTEILFFLFFFLLLILHCKDFISQFNSLNSLNIIKFFIHSDCQCHISYVILGNHGLL